MAIQLFPPKIKYMFFYHSSLPYPIDLAPIRSNTSLKNYILKPAKVTNLELVQKKVSSTVKISGSQAKNLPEHSVVNL